MKKVNTVCILSLAAFATTALVSCNQSAEPFKDRPGVIFEAHAFTRSKNPEGSGVVLTETAFIDGDCATIEIENGDNLKYGEDVVIHIEPKKFFTFCAWELKDNPLDEDWKPIGEPIKPYVGLGSPNIRYSYPLAENVAWEFKDESTDIEGGYKHERYKITVKKDFFRKNIVIAYGVGGENPVYVHDSEYYRQDVNLTLQSLTPDENDNHTNPVNQYLCKNEQKSSFAAAGKGIFVTIEEPNTDDDRKSKYPSNRLISMDGWDVPTETPDETTGKTTVSYDKVKVYGVTKDKDGNEVEVDVSYYDKDTQDEHFYVVRTGHLLTVFTPWASLVENDKDYTPKFKSLRVCLDDNPYVTKVTIADKLGDGSHVYGGYYNSYKQMNWETNELFKPQTFHIDNEHFGGVSDNYLRYEIASKDEYGDLVGLVDEIPSIDKAYCGAAIICPKSQSPKITITTTNHVKDEEVTKAETIEANSTTASTTNWRNKFFQGESGSTLTHEELQYWSIKDANKKDLWQLVKITSDKDAKHGPIDLADEGIEKFKFFDANDLYYLVPAKDDTTTSAYHNFAEGYTTVNADEINITIEY